VVVAAEASHDRLAEVVAAAVKLARSAAAVADNPCDHSAAEAAVIRRDRSAAAAVRPVRLAADNPAH
jgi:hypothetical protein